MLYVWFLKNMSTVWIAEETSERGGEGERRMENGEWRGMVFSSAACITT